MTHHPFAKTIAVAVAAVVLTAGTVAAVGTSPFSDTSGHEHEAEIVLANSKGLFQGYVDKTFRPDQTLTNRQSEVVLGRLLDRYTDDDGNSTLTRAEAAVVLTRGVCGLDGDCEAAQPGPVARVNEDGEGNGPGAGPSEDEPEPPTVTEPPEPPTVTLPPVAAISPSRAAGRRSASTTALTGIGTANSAASFSTGMSTTGITPGSPLKARATGASRRSPISGGCTTRRQTSHRQSSRGCLTVSGAVGRSATTGGPTSM